MTTRLEQLEDARDKLLTGETVVRVKDRDGTEVEFTSATISQLNQAISNEKATQASTEGGCWNGATFGNEY